MDELVKQKFDAYPNDVRLKLMEIRKAIYEVAAEIDIEEVNETLKWGEPSYLVKGGSTVRIDWKPKHPERIQVCFHCQTKLIDTYKEIYSDTFSFEGNRAILLPLSENLPVQELKHCLSMSLRYHKIKHLPLLGS